jgi:hypothetical protein
LICDFEFFVPPKIKSLEMVCGLNWKDFLHGKAEQDSIFFCVT